MTGGLGTWKNKHKIKKAVSDKTSKLGPPGYVILMVVLAEAAFINGQSHYLSIECLDKGLGGLTPGLTRNAAHKGPTRRISGWSGR